MKYTTYQRSTQLIKNRLTKINALVDDLVKKKDTLTSVQINSLSNYSKEIVTKRNEFDRHLQRVLETLTDEEEKDNTLAADQDFVNDTFAEISSKIETLIPQTEDPRSPVSVHSGARVPFETPTSSVRLPKLELKQFSGDPLSWVSFINLFDTTIHNNASLSNVSKFQYLVSVLSGEPLSLIRSLTISAANYLVAYNLLKERYHSHRRLTTLHLNQMLDLPDISHTSSRHMRAFVNAFYENSQALKALQCDITTNNPLLSALILRKMDNELRKRLEAYRSTHPTTDDRTGSRELPQIEEIIKFLNEECTHTEEASLHSTHQAKPTPKHSSLATYQHKNAPPRRHPHNANVAMTATHTAKNSTPAPCFVCKSTEHKVYSCSVFKNKTPHQRYQLVKDNHRCISCLGNHDLKDCRSKSHCFTCQKRHHTLIHFTHTSSGQQITRLENKTSGDSQPSPPKDMVVMSTQGAANYSEHCASTVLLSTTLVQITTPSGNSHIFRALLDSGSMCEFISERATQLLGARRMHSSHVVVGLSQTSTRTKGILNLNISTLSGYSIATEHPLLILDKISVELPRTQISPEVLRKVQPYHLADPTFHLPAGIDILLGGSLFPKILTNETHSLGSKMPYMIGTHFGYVVMGKAPCLHTPASDTCFTTSLLSINDNDLHASLQKFWQQEEPPFISKKSEEEKQCDEHFAQTHSRDPSGRYCVRLPFKHNHIPLGQSQHTANTRLASLERKFCAQPQFKQLYVDFMSDYENSGHMELVDPMESDLPHYFLPHHGVLKETSSTTKLRTVFDASSKTTSGVSLNDILMTGRKLQTNICDIILNYRIHNIVFSCDIRQMYRQIKVHPDDQRYQLILWREETSQPISLYRLTTVTYGMNSSPYLAIRTLHQLADDEGTDFPEAASVLRSQSYIDDILAGAQSVDSAQRLQSQISELLKRGGFELRKWVSNSESLLQNLPREHLETPVFLQDDQQPHFSILGLQWSPVTDSFTYKLSIPQDAQTKRQILSIIAQIYDPCGFLAPITMWAKCFMQILWTKSLDWDQPLPVDLSQKWQNFTASTKSLQEIHIPRSLHLSQSCSIELHGFCDASERGYAAVIYFRCLLNDDCVIVRQVFSKTRVAPLKKVTLPRLELCAAHLLSKLVAYVVNIFTPRFNFSSMHLWSDSSVVLAWISSPTYQLKTYIANRVAQIQEVIPSQRWHHVISNQNPADVASRGLLPSHLPDHDLWWNGPPWLRLHANDWPLSQPVPVNLLDTGEVKTSPLSVLVTTTPDEWDLLSKFSSFIKLQRVLAYILRFLHNSRKLPLRRGPLSTKELHAAKHLLFRLVQASSFCEDIGRVKRKMAPSSQLRRLSPFLDPDGLLRVGGRLKAAQLSSDARHPVILPKRHHVVYLLIDHCHQRHLHSGVQLTQALLAQQVWILAARSAVRSRIFKCITCFKNRPRTQIPLMGDLPASRVVPTRPFSHTGTDFGGPFMVKVHNLRFIRHVKVYICLFVCFSTKAVHIEVVTDLTTDAFIAALTRFVARRGLCQDIYCDCGTNFVGADAALRKVLDSTLRAQGAKVKISDYATNQGINFHFNPPSAPHLGGLWESAIKSAKHHLRRVIGEHVLTLPEFITLTTQVEAMLNSRPLTPLSGDPTDLSALTPGHFLIGAPLAALPEPDFQDIPNNRLKHWQLIQALHQRMWKRWQLEYLHTLQQRAKWYSPTENLKEGDLVLVHQSSPPRSWPLARVIGLSPGKDGIVRVVHLKTQHGTLTRPVVKVFALPIDSSSN